MEAENKRDCSICNVCCSSIMQLCEHVAGNRHKKKLGSIAPHELKRLSTIQLFLDMHMIGEPILGLEYILETLADSVYAYNCLLCGVQGDWRKMITHILDTDHMIRYIDKHNPELSLGKKTFPKKGLYLQELRVIAKVILAKSGCKSIQAHKLEPSDPNAAEDGDINLNSLHTSKSGNGKKGGEDTPEADARKALKRTPLKKKKDSATAAKVARLSNTARRNDAEIMSEEQECESRECESEPDWTASIQELQFRRNQDLLNYLRNYKIQSDGDAHYIQQVICNCTDALGKFREQQAKEERPQGAPAPQLPTRSQPTTPKYGYPDWNRPEGPYFPVRTPDTYVSGSQPPRQPPYPILLPPTTATEMFFNSIKNMEEAEVVNVFQKIAATNPAFRGINIPSTIQYLKETGRLRR